MENRINKNDEDLLFHDSKEKIIDFKLNKIVNSPFSNESKIIRKRNLGIDLLRIIAMFFIINHHIIYHGGPLFGTKILTFENNLLLFFNTILCSGVNMFGMISGFVGFHSHKYSNLIYLFFQTFLYNCCIRFYFKKKKPDVSQDISNFIYPVFRSGYWYFNAYFSLYFFLPLINSGIKAMNKREMEIFVLSIFLLFSCFNQVKHYSTKLNLDFFKFNNGFTYMWLIILYCYGSFFGRFKHNTHNYKFLLNILIYIGISCFVAFLRNIIIIYKLKNNINVDKMRVEYTCPSSVIISICFIIIFSQINIKSKLLQKLISFFSPLTYGIYLIHNHALVLGYIIKNRYLWLLKYNIHKLNLTVFIESSKIFIICIFIDYLRFISFKFFKIRELSTFISNFLGIIGNRIIFILKKIF